MDARTHELEAWEERLRRAERDLSERERQALSDDPSPTEMLAFAAERDKIARERAQIAMSYDERAQGRDRAGLDRDVAASGRDRRARAVQQDRDPAVADRWSAGTDRDLGAGDRGDSYEDRGRSQRAREQAADGRADAADDRDEAARKAAQQEREIEGLRAALEARLIIGQAQGMVMVKYQLTADKAFAVLVRLSQHQNIKVRTLAAQIVATGGDTGD
ncbi:MAG: hypothetical protein NVSMB55_25700 [Mycobacteriales bacterium]